jgi:hypothetical protein
VASWSEIEEADGAVLATIENAGPVYESFRKSQPTVAVLVPKQLQSLVGKG